jgi:hypothetical protein
MFAVPRVEFDDYVVSLRRAAWGGREGTEGFERGGAVPRRGEEAEARERRSRERERGEVDAEVGERGEGGEARGKGVVERERRRWLGGERAEEGERAGRRGRRADSVERDHGVVQWERRR